MPVEIMSYMLSAENMRRRLTFQLILQCAPFFKGMKIACTANMEKGICKEADKLLQDTGVERFILNETEERCLLFFFRRKKLASYLMRPEVREFLRTYGYEAENVDKALGRLSDRICQSAGESSGFPHEIGIFLNYPVEDVKGFIRERGRNCLLSGYWKVYESPGRAQMTFSAYDRAKQSAVNQFLSGMSLQEIILS